MTDISIETNENGSFTIDFENGDFKLTQGFDSLIRNILFSDARAPEDRVLIPEKRRGWMGDLASRVEGRNSGSLLWLLDQGRLDSTTLNESIIFSQQALNILVEDGFCNNVEVTGAIVPRSGIRLTIIITSLIGETTNHYVNLWRQTGDNT